MKLKLKSNPSTRGFSIILMMVYGLYALFNKGFSTLLLSFAVGLIFYGFKESLELTAVVIIAVGILLSFFMKRAGIEGFENAKKDDEKQDGETKEEKEGEEKKKTTEKFEDKKETSGSEDVKKMEKATTSGFTDINPAPVGQFKLGEIPKDEKGGFHIDQGTTLMNALNGLKPDQIKAMTNDTKQLIETQKSLMGMLDTLAPMMKEGSNLLNMFNGMFGQK
jgi:hypothetical protein